MGRFKFEDTQSTYLNLVAVLIVFECHVRFLVMYMKKINVAIANAMIQCNITDKSDKWFMKFLIKVNYLQPHMTSNIILFCYQNTLL